MDRKRCAETRDPLQSPHVVVDHPFPGTRGMSVTPEAFQRVYNRTMTPSVR
jgi:hypothetical protein